MSTTDGILMAKKNTHVSYKYYDLVMAAFVTVLIAANIIGPAKNLTT
jgi:hypothetical protein